MRHAQLEAAQAVFDHAYGLAAPAIGAEGRAEVDELQFKSVQSGAATQVWAATAPDIANGAYLADCGPGVLGANPSVNGFRPYLLDDDHAAALWTLSESLVGESFDLPL